MLRSVLALLLLACPACSRAEPDAPPAAAPTGRPGTPGATTGPATAATVAASPGPPDTFQVSGELYEFDYSYPAEAGRIPALRASLDAERDKLRGQLFAEARQGRDEARQAGFEYQPHALAQAWLKVAETPRFLSLSAQVYTFAGGAHPNHGFDSLVWDKQANARVEPLALFLSPAAFDRAVQARFCAELDRQRAKRREAPVRRDSGDEFDRCIAPSEQTVILGSSTGRAIDRIGVLVAPYAAGPYVEGDYEVTLPVTPAVLAAVRPQFRPAFAPLR